MPLCSAQVAPQQVVQQQGQFSSCLVSYVPQAQMSTMAQMQGPNQVTHVTQPQGQPMQFHYVTEDSQLMPL